MWYLYWQGGFILKPIFFYYKMTFEFYFGNLKLQEKKKWALLYNQSKSSVKHSFLSNVYFLRKIFIYLGCAGS